MSDAVEANLPSFQLAFANSGGKVILRLVGRIASSNSANVTEQLQAAAAEAASDVVLDLSELTYLTSAGFRALFIFGDELETRGLKCVLCCANETVYELFEMGGMLDVFSVFKNLEEAVGAP